MPEITAKGRLEDAIREYLAEHEDADDGAILTGWVVVATTFVPQLDGRADGYWKIIPEGQPIHVSLGLLAEAQQTYFRNALLPADEGDDG